MDRLTLVDKDLSFVTRYAAPSVLTGRFVACVVNSDRETLTEAFTDAGEIQVHNMDNLYADKSYIGFNYLAEIREDGDDLIIILSKEETHERDSGE